MKSLTKPAGLLLCFVASTGCQHESSALFNGPAPRAAAQIQITAESGSEVVITKYASSGEGGQPEHTNSAQEILVREPAAFLSSRTMFPSKSPATISALADPTVPAFPETPAPLGNLRQRQWEVRAGETLYQAISRFAERAQHSAKKPQVLPVWEITADAAFEGEFVEALEWLMEGFAHTEPRPVLTVHPNRLILLTAE